MSDATPDLETIAKKVILKFGKSSRYGEIWEVLGDHGFSDPDGEIAAEVWDMIQAAKVTVKIPYIGY